ncbi:MAG TPA: efflux RND transporter periplasmic adaptor subunit [Vicinamibacteria bacterium]
MIRRDMTQLKVTRKKVVVGVLAALGALLAFRLYGALWGGGGGDARGGGPGGERAQPVEVARAERTDLSENVTLVGSLRAKEQVDVAPKVGGRLVELRVDLGDAVKVGQLIARLEDGELSQQVRRAEAALQVSRAAVAQREAELDNLKMEAERHQSLERDGIISSQQSAQIQTQVRVGEAQVELSRAQMEESEATLEELRIRLSQTDIFAPISGVVARRYVDAGALLSANDPVVLIINLTRMVTVVNIPERQVFRVQVNDEAKVSVDALGGEETTGRVVRISPLLDAQTRTAAVEIEIPNPEGHLKGEMFARVDLNLTLQREAIFIPRQALVYRSAEPGVFVVDSDVARFQPVRIGAADGDRIEAMEGLEPGQIIVTRGANLLQNGDRIQIPVE